MKGFPKHLNSKQDYFYIREKFPSSMWKPAWQALLDGEKNWFCTGKLESKEDGVKNRTHKVVEVTNHDGETEYYQYEQQFFLFGQKKRPGNPGRQNVRVILRLFSLPAAARLPGSRPLQGSPLGPLWGPALLRHSRRSWRSSLPGARCWHPRGPCGPLAAAWA